MWMHYFMVGTLSTMSLNAFLSRAMDELLTAAVSVAGGVASAVVVAWMQRRWERQEEGKSR